MFFSIFQGTYELLLSHFFGECRNGLTGSRLLINDSVGPLIFFVCCFLVSLIMIHRVDHGINILNVESNWAPKEFSCAVST